MSRRRNMSSEDVKPELPITPMLDMSFQLLAFFVMTFKPTPTEGQIAMTLPPAETGGGSGIPSPADDKPVKYIVEVNAAENGTIASMTIQEDGSPDKPKDLPDIGAYFAELKRLYASLGSKPGKLTVKMGDKLLQAYVVQLVDHGIRAGFTDLAPVPIDPKKQ